MKRIIALASFALALSFVSGADDKISVVNATVGSRMDLRGDLFHGKVVRCTVKTSEGKTFPVSDAIGKDVCEIVIWEAKLVDAGIWTMTTFTDSYKTIQNKFEIFMSQDVYIKPALRIWANEGQWVTAWFDGNDTDVTACTLKATLGTKEYNLMHGAIEDIERYRGCGVRMHATKERSQQWELHRKIGKYVTEHAQFHINVPNADEDDEPITYHRFDLGAPAELGVQSKQIAFCQMTKPDGTLTPFQYGGCSFRIPVVTNFHEGVWHVNYALRSKVDMLHKEFHVTVWDTESLKVTQETGVGKEIHLLCRTGVPVLKFCSFTRPDKKIIHLPAGVGNDNYSYYGDGYEDGGHTRYYGDCGITIHKPTEVDFGLWICEMGVSNGDTVANRGAVIEVVKARAERTYKIDSPQVIVKSGDSFKIRCKVNASLDYCWLTSPNGTIYSVSSGDSSSTTLKYGGKSFSMGDCSAIVDRADTSDNGKWTCHLGISGRGELETEVSVDVTDSYLIAHEIIVNEKSTAKLSCGTFLEEEGSLKYCRWVRPDGSGLNQKDAARYAAYTKMDSCDLTILAIAPEDIGRWTCAALLTGFPREEQRATIELNATNAELTSTSIILIVLGCGLLTITLVGAFLAAMYIYKRRNVPEKKQLPPPYDSENYIAHVRRADSEDITMNKDYKY